MNTRNFALLELLVYWAIAFIFGLFGNWGAVTIALVAMVVAMRRIQVSE